MMDRLQKKCFFASAGFHAALFGILIFGSAMMTREDDAKNWHPITVFNSASVSDNATAGGGVQANAAPPTPVNPLPPNPVEPKPVIKPVEPVQPVQPTEPKIVPPKPVAQHTPKPTHEPKPSDKPDLFANPVKPNRTPKKPTVDTSDLLQTKRNTQNKKNLQPTESAEEVAARNARAKAAREFANSYKTLTKNLAPSSMVMPTLGTGSSGELSVNYRDIIASKYYNAWSAPLELDDTTPVVVASITITRDGSVKSARITKRSGNNAMDRSIQNVLDIVTFIEAFPAGSTDNERTVTIKFSVQAKRQIG